MGNCKKMTMRKGLLILIFIPIVSFGQGTNELKRFLADLYQGFPLEANEKTINDYLKNNTGYQTRPNIYDSSRIDYFKTVNLDSFLKYKPLSSSFEHYYTYGWPVGNKIIEHSITSSLTIFYGDSLNNECKYQLDDLVKHLKRLTGNSKGYEIYADAGKVGYGWNFYRRKTDKIPFLTIDLTNRSCTSSSCYLYIAYHKLLNVKKTTVHNTRYK
jgi:hypothetical protein